MILLWALALLFTGEAIDAALRSNFNFGSLIVYGLAVAGWGYALFYRQIDHFLLCCLPGKILLGFLAVGNLIFCVVLFVFVVWGGYSCPPTGDEQVMIVLGAGLRKDRPSQLLRYRLDRAAEYYQEHPDLLIVTTGGQGRQETCPEGLAMKRYLVEKGVPEERIISEEKSNSTEQNFAFAKQLLTQRGITEDTPVVLVTNGFHCWRGRQYAAMAGFRNVTSLAAGVPLDAIIPCYGREVFAILYYKVFRTTEDGWGKPFVGLLSASKQFFYK